MAVDDPLDPACPCASGRRLRQCCMVDGGADFTPEEAAAAFDRVLVFGARAEFATARRRLNRQLLVELSDAEDEAMERLHADDSATGLLVLVHLDLPCHHGQSLAARLLVREGPTMPPRERAALATLAANPSSLFEVLDVYPGQGMVLRDLLRRFTVRVRERTASTIVEPGWALLTKARRQPDGTPVLDMPLLPFDHGMRAVVDEWLARRRLDAPASPVDPRPALAELFRLWQLTMAARRTQPQQFQFTNRDGERLDPCAATLRGDGKRLRAWLERAPDWQRDVAADGRSGAAHWMWFQVDENGWRHALGHLAIAADRFELRVDSRARLDRAVALLRAAVDAELIDVKALATVAGAARDPAGRQSPGRALPAAADVPQDVKDQVLKATFDRHYRAWLDSPLPAFGGLSPRTLAQRDPAAVAQMVWRICHTSGVTYDGRWLYAELGLQPLGEAPFTPGLGAD